MTSSTTRPAAMALDGTTLVVVQRSARANGTWRSFSAPCDGSPAGIRAALAALGNNVPVDTRVSITLTRPLAHLRTVPFPPSMSRASLEAVLARDWMRWLIGHRVTAHTVAVKKAAKGQWRAAFAPTDTLDALVEASAAHGWRDPILQVGDDALASLTRTTGNERSTAVIVCDANGPTDGVLLAADAPVMGRTFPTNAVDGDVTSFLSMLAPAGQVVILGPPTRSNTLSRALMSAGHTTRVVDTALDGECSALALHAIAGAHGHPVIRLSTAASRALAARATRGLTAALAIAAAAALLVAFAIERSGITRQLAEVQRDRSAIAAQVTQAMDARARVEEDVAITTAIRRREALAARASTALASIAVALPAGSAFTAVTMQGDSLTLEGESGRSAAVYEALKASPLLDQVRLAAPLRQTRQAGSAAMEGFAFAARLRPRSRTR